MLIIRDLFTEEYRHKKTRKFGKPGTTGNYVTGIAFILMISKN